MRVKQLSVRMCVARAGTAAHFEDYLSRLWDVKYTFQYVVLTPSSRPIMDSGFGPSVALSKPYFC